MSVIIKMTFPSGRYHATPWGRHVNEGVPEWPPSPWRLLRALVAVWKRTCPEVAIEVVERILRQLAAPPQFHLPDYRVAHTRHYMPWEKKGPDDRALVFDTFVVLGREDDLIIGWPAADLSVSDRVILQQLLSNLTSLGRAEGWVDASLCESHDNWNCIPATADHTNPVPVLCADPATAFADTYYPTLDPKKLAKGKVNFADYLFDCPRWHLCLDTQTLHENRWSSVPGASWVNYQRPQESQQRRIRFKPKERPNYLRFRLDGPVLPLITDTLLFSDAFRVAAMSRFKHSCESVRSTASAEVSGYLRSDDSGEYASPTLSGKAADGTRLMSHKHARYLATSEGVDPQRDTHPQRITHLTIFAENGFSPQEVTALATLRTLNSYFRLKGVRVQLAEQGSTLTGSQSLDALTRQSSEWVSSTPFLGYAPVGNAGRLSYLRKTIRRDWRKFTELTPSLQNIQLISVEELLENDPAWMGKPRPFEFQRARPKDRETGPRPCGVFRLRFSDEIAGPLCLGYGSHFGMGLFIPTNQ